MSRWLNLILLMACASAQAAPATEDDVERFMAEKGLLNHVADGATAVAQKTSAAADRASHLVFTAMGFLGVPYRRGGNSVDTGFDCSGFVKAMYEQTLGLALPRRASEQAAATERIDRRDLRPGDLVFFNTLRRTFSHVGIYVGDGKFIHSPRPGARVRVDSMSMSYWARRFDGARRVIPAESATASAEPDSHP